jgi:hypothetical protein
VVDHRNVDAEDLGNLEDGLAFLEELQDFQLESIE